MAMEAAHGKLRGCQTRVLMLIWYLSRLLATVMVLAPLCDFFGLVEKV